MKMLASLLLLTTLAGGSQLAAEPAAVAPVDGAATMKYSPLLFGYFIEHFDTVVYGGLYDQSSPLSDGDGFRKDVIDALRAAKCSIVRWTGANLSATILSGDSPDAYNDIGNENRVVPQKVKLPVAEGKISLPCHAVAAIELK